MANELNDLIPHLNAALDVVSQKQKGMLRAVARAPSAARAAKGTPVKYPVIPEVTAVDAAPSMTLPEGAALTYGERSLTITRDKVVHIPWNGEQTLAMRNAGLYDSTLTQTFAAAFETIGLLIEADLASTYTQAARAVGTAGTTPFGTVNNFMDFANINKEFEDAGVQGTDLHLVLSSTAAANLRGIQASLFKANEAGSDAMLRMGTLGTVEGLAIHSSAKIAAHTPGTAAATYLTDLVAGYAVGSTSIHLDTGTGTTLAGDVVTFAGDTTKYVVTTGAAGDGDKDIVLGTPGLLNTLANDVAMTTGAAYRANLAFPRYAIHLVTRQPSLPDGGDAATDRQAITDPNTGLVYDVAVYRGNRMINIQIGIVWGWEVTKPSHLFILQG